MEENQQDRAYSGPKITAPYAVASLVMGVASLVISGLGITLVLAIIGLVFSKKGLAEYNAHPEYYSGESMLKVGKITSIIAIVLSSIALLLIILAIVGFTAMAIADM